VLNAECAFVPCHSTSAQVQWLIADLAANPRQCVAAIWHEPRFTSGPHGDATWTQPFWDALYAAGADVVINGHDHHYERFLPLNPQGGLDTARGITEFIVGTGGVGGVTFSGTHANSVVKEGATLGVLQLTLRASSFDWRFVPVAGKTFTDSGTASCH
jgi:hypothetical protein